MSMEKNPWIQVFRGKGSVYALDEDTKQWADRGTSGTVVMFQNAESREDVRIKWEKSDREIWWQLTSSKLKPKGERALVLKAWATTSNKQEILAIRFSHQDMAILFATKYHNIFPLAISANAQIENIFNTANKQNANDNKKQEIIDPKRQSIMSLPDTILAEDEPKQIQQFQPNYGILPNRTGPAPPPPKIYQKPPPPRRRSRGPSASLNGGFSYNPRVSLVDHKPLPEEPEHVPFEQQLQPLPQHQEQPPIQQQPQQVPVRKLPVKADPNMRPPIWNRPQPQNEPVALEFGDNNNNSSDDPPGAWKCVICTYQNSEASHKCSMCGLPKGSGANDVNPAQLKRLANGYRDDDDDVYEDPNGLGPNNGANKWKCKACTFANDLGVDRCEVCSAKRRIDDEDVSDNNRNLQININNLRHHQFNNHNHNQIQLGHGIGDEEAAIIRQQMMAERQAQQQQQQGMVDEVGSPKVYNQIPPSRFNYDQFANHNNNGGGMPMGGKDWNCPICTLLNSYKNPRCEACNTPRNVGPYNPAPHAHGGHGHNPQMMNDQINGMMNQMIYNPIPEAKYNGQYNNNYGANAGASHDPFQRMMNMSMHHENQYNVNLMYNDPNNPFQPSMYNSFDDGFFESTREDFSRAASDIACFNDSPASVFSTLRSVAKKLLKDDARYRTLDTTNPKVMERLIGYEGVLDFLMLLGFESDAMGMKLVCAKKPSPHVVQNAIQVLNSYGQRFKMTNGGFNQIMQHNYNMQQYRYINNNNNQYPANNQYQLQNGGGYAANNGGGPQLQFGGNEPMNINPNMMGDDGMMNQPSVATAGWGDDDEEWNADKSNNDNKRDILTLEQIIVWATHENMQDTDTMDTLLMTHKLFTDSLTLLQQLKRRFFVPIPPDCLNAPDEEKEEVIKRFQVNIQKRIQLKVIKAVRDWMKNYYSEDFHEQKEVLKEFDAWLDELSIYDQNTSSPYNKNCTWIKALYLTVKSQYDRFAKTDWEKELQKKLNFLATFDDIEIEDKQISTIMNKATAEELADQITLMDYTLFSRIEPRECVHQRWKDPRQKKLAPNILSLIQQFNNFTIFIQIMILRESKLKSRALAIKRIIKMGEHFRTTRNYNSLCAVFSALNSAPIHRLKIAWSRVPEKNRQIFHKWGAIFCRDGNHRMLRSLLRKAGGNPCIPHIGVFLQDLVFIDEGNKKKVAIEAFQGKKMLNFKKCIRIADRVKNLQMFQKNKYSAIIKENRTTQKVILIEFEKLAEVTEDQIWDMSTLVKKQDAKEAKAPLGVFGVGGGGKHAYNQIPDAQPQEESQLPLI